MSGGLEPTLAARRDDEDDDDDDRRRGRAGWLVWFGGVVAFLVSWLLRLAILFGLVGVAAWLILRFLGGILPGWLAGALQSLVDAALWLFGPLIDLFMRLACLVGLFCPVETGPVELPAAVAALVCPAGETEVDGVCRAAPPVCGPLEEPSGSDCICIAGTQRAADGVCAAPPVEPAIQPLSARLAAAGEAGLPAAWWFYGTTRNSGGTAFAARLAADGACEAAALVAVGTASADNESGRNDEFSGLRAERLGRELGSACGAGATTIFTLRLGGYLDQPDSDAQRRLVVMRVDGDEAPTLTAVAAALCAPGVWSGGAVEYARYAAFAIDDVCRRGFGNRLAPMN